MGEFLDVKWYLKKKRVLFMITDQSFQNVQTNKPSAVVVLLTFCTNKTR